MKDCEKISVAVSVFYEIRDSEMYGGIGSVGYMCTSVDGGLKMLENDFEAYVAGQKKYVASGLGVPEECVSIITKEEYELNTDADEN